MSWKKVKLGDILKQYRIEHRVDDKAIYKQVSILNDGSVVLRGEKIGKEIGRKRQFIIDTKKHPNTLIFTRQLLLQGSIGITSGDVHGCIVTENMPMFSIDTTKIDKEFLILFLKSKVFKSRIREIELSGSAQKSIHEKTFLNLEFSLPPFQLQKEIVVELLKLKGSSDAISAELTHQLNLVKKLRQQLLQDAVQGKLVEQNATDEPASELLKKIKAEKQKLTAEKKLKKEKELPPIKPEEIPFEIPGNWEWCRLGEICGFITKGTTPDFNKINEESKIPYLKVYNIVDQKINFEYKPQFIDETTHREVLKRSIVYPNDVLMNIVGPPLCKVAIVPFTFSEWNINQALAIFRPLLIEINRFLYFYLCEGSAIQKLIPLGVVGQDNLSLEQCRNLIFPLPPLAEQNRIVKKVDELMHYCNELEASIKQSESQNEKLLQQVLREALRKEPVGV